MEPAGATAPLARQPSAGSEPGPGTGAVQGLETRHCSPNTPKGLVGELQSPGLCKQNLF